jgi:hypothetical protein
MITAVLMVAGMIGSASAHLSDEYHDVSFDNDVTTAWKKNAIYIKDSVFHHQGMRKDGDHSVHALWQSVYPGYGERAYPEDSVMRSGPRREGNGARGYGRDHHNSMRHESWGSWNDRERYGYPPHRHDDKEDAGGYGHGHSFHGGRDCDNGHAGAPVPLPNTLVLLVSGLAGFVVYRKMRVI